jgi:hypothetical protein
MFRMLCYLIHLTLLQFLEAQAQEEQAVCRDHRTPTCYVPLTNLASP